jgi:hypothetical protein
MAYDSQRHVTVLFGGYNGSAGLQDTWEWDGTTWTMGTQVAPPPRVDAAMSYDSQREVMVLFGGTGSTGGTWELEPPCTSPSIETQPSSRSVCQNGSAPFSITASGSAPLIQWQIQTDPNTWATMGNDLLSLPCGGSAYASPPNAASTQIGVIPCPGATSYQIRCVVSNACGSATSDQATYTVCYANCDCSATAPTLNVADFTCFLQKFAAADPYANCDASTTPPIFNVADFTCFLQKFAAGCP